MLNTRKLLYILPDMAYVAELLPTKKEHTFSIQSFRQINGEFLTEDDDLIAENIEKLFSKLEPETYHLVLPDFLFTNTILEIKETQESKVKQHIKDELLPSLGLSKSTHEIETFILTQYGNVTKIQLTALEKEVVQPISRSAAKHKITIEHISPLSWTIKSVISLEPSISVIQIGSVLYLAEHYIGVDQCTMANVDDLENIGEAIKTLKGAQPSIQTIYLITNSLVEEKLKDLVSATLPIQQLASFKDEDTQMPSYVREIIESGMKTLDISEYPVPSFDLPKPASASASEAETAIPTITTPKPLDVFADEDAVTIESTETVEVETSETLAVLDTSEIEEDDDVELDDELPEPTAQSTAEEVTAADQSDEIQGSENTKEDTVELEAAVVSASLASSNESSGASITDSLSEIDGDLQAAFSSTKDEGLHPDSSPDATVAKEDERDDIIDTAVPAPPSKPPVIKNKGGNGAWLKMLLIMLMVFLVTVAVGVGIGLLVLRLTGQSLTPTPAPEPSPSPVASVAPSPSPSPSPEPVERGELSILVVNATTQAGYAGGTRTKLVNAGYEEVTAANAKGEYEPGLYVLMPENNPALVAALSADSGLNLTFAEGYNTEDPTAQYNAVVVLAEWCR